MSAASCIVADVDECYDLSSNKLVRARKPWKCGECGDPIKPGDLYEHHKGLYDGMWDQHRTCARCCNVRRDYFESWYYGMMAELFQEAHGFDYRKGIPADFAPCARVDEVGG